MKILHTSDWHLGRLLYGKKRDHEFNAFLAWLLRTLTEQTIDVLIVAGDVFDTNAPSHQAQTQYYQFLCQVAATGCRHVVIVAGNHDSPTFINAPKELLQALDVHVVGHASLFEPEHDVLALKNAQGQTELIVCAVPYLRDRDVRLAQSGESVEEKAQKTREGIALYYAKVAAVAEQMNRQLAQAVPIVATGHLFTAGGTTLADDGVRDLYVGSLAYLSVDLFPPIFDYIALGHLHVPQRVANSETIRYSGSPIAMGFGEATQQKSVCVVQFNDQQQAQVELVPVPVFQALLRLQGDWEQIQHALLALKVKNESVWLEIIYNGQAWKADLREEVEALIAQSPLEVLRIQNQSLTARSMQQRHAEESLDQLTETEVFERCLADNQVDADQQPELLGAYQEILTLAFEIKA